MSIKLSWGSQNTNADAVTIYRSLTKIDLANLPAALATLPGTAVDYVDATVARNTIYNYVIAITKGADTVLSQNKLYGHFPDTGPGPATLLRGTWQEGYFGTLTQAEFYTNSELCTTIRSDLAGSANNSIAQVWHKFILDGKILFIPQFSISTNLSLSNIYSAGAMYGTDDFGLHFWPGKGINSLAGMNQNKVIVKSGYNFLVRLPKATTSATNVIAPSTWDDTYSNGEWYRTMGRIFLNASTQANMRPRWDDFLYVGGSNYNAQGLTFTQHFNTASGTTVQCGGGTSFDQLYTSGNTLTTGYYWRPVLELIL